MPPRKRTSSLLNGDAKQDAAAAPETAEESHELEDALALAEQAEAEAVAAEAAATAARARARALALRRKAEAAAATTKVSATAATVDVAKVQAAETSVVDHPTEVEPATVDPSPTAAPPVFVATASPDLDETEAVEVDEPSDLDESTVRDGLLVEDDVDETDEESDEESGRRRFRLRRPRPKTIAAALVVFIASALLGASLGMVLLHREFAADQQHSAEFAAAARQGVVTLMSLNFNSAESDVKRILDNTTGDFKKDFESQASQFTQMAQESKVVTEATVNSAAVQSISTNTATVLVAVTTKVSNAASNQQEPRSWRLRVNVARDGDQIKLAKVEFVP